MLRRRIETTTSRTAEWTCVSRAASSLESDSHYRSDDHIAFLLIPTFLKLLLHISLVKKFFRQVIAPKGIYEYTIVRTKYTDAVFKEIPAKGFDKNRTSLFLLERLLLYLQPESVDETFKVIQRFAGEGSEVVFDYVRAPVLRQAGSYYGEKEIVKSVAKAGERWYFGIEEGEVERFLKNYGLRVSEPKDALELERIYFTDASGEIVGRVNGTHCLVRAVKPEGR